MSQNEALFRAIFEGLDDAVVICDRRRTIRKVNPAFTTIFGFAAAEVIGRQTSFLYVDYGEYLRVGRERLLPGARGTPWLGQFRRSDGTEFPAETVALRVASGGRMLGYVGLLRDVSERERAYERLRVSEDLFATAFANNPAAIALTRLDDGIVLNVNDSWLVMTGESRASIIGQSARFMWPSREDGAQFIQQLRQSGRLQGWEQTFSKRSGEPFHAEIAAQVLTMQGEPVILSTLVDISKRRRAEYDLRELAASLENRVDERTAELAAARDAAKAAGYAKGEFLANMSHEIRTPLNAIIGLTDLMLGAGDTAAEQRRLRQVREAAQYLLRIVNGVLDLSKIEAGKFELEDVPFDLERVIESAVSIVAEPARNKGLELVVDTDDLPTNLRGDPTKLTQALLNLLSNAVKFSSRGSVTIRCRLKAREGSQLLICFEVQDTGPGVPPDDIGRLFAAFEQGDTSTTRRFGGTGLGLIITLRIAELMGGTAGVESRLGLGSTFWFTVRLSQASTSPPRATVLDGLRALVIDDLPTARSALSTMLRHFGMVAETASSGKEGIRLAAAAADGGRPFDVWIVDSLMPDLDGIATILRLRQLAKVDATPAILLSAGEIIAIGTHASAISSVLTKPVFATALREELLAGFGIPRALTSDRDLDAESLAESYDGKRVLLAEDNPVNQYIACELLRKVGMDVDVAGDGLEAVAMAKRGNYDLILMDVQMPEMDGLSATKIIRQTSNLLHTPIIALTADAFTENREACLSAGMNDYVGKPVSAQELYRAVKKWLPIGT